MQNLFEALTSAFRQSQGILSHQKYLSILSKHSPFDEDAPYTPGPVGQLLPNGFGLFDMLGNVGEYVWDRYEPYTDETSELINPWGAHVSRGGNCHSHPYAIHAGLQRSWGSSPKTKSSGFRVVRMVAAD